MMATPTVTVTVNTATPESSSGSTTVLAIATVLLLIIIGLLVTTFSVAAICVCARWRRRRVRRELRSDVPATAGARWLQEGFEIPVCNSPPKEVIGRNNYAGEATNTSTDPSAEQINRWSVSAVSGASGELSESDDDTLSCPPSPAVSSLGLEEDDVVRHGSWGHSPPILHQTNINPHSSLPCITEVCESHSASN